MANDVFNRASATVGAAYSADSSSLTFSNVANGANTVSLLVQSLQATYSQAITRLYELGSAATTFIQGRTQGSVSLSRIIGPAKTGADFIAQFGSVCNLDKNTIIFNLNAKKQEQGCTEGSNEGFIATGCVIQSLSYSVSSQDIVIQQQLQMQIVSLEKTKN
jgi:hypothetical protein